MCIRDSEKGVMSSPDPKPGRTSDPATVALVKDFYQNDEVSRQMPGKKDFASVKKYGKRVHLSLIHIFPSETWLVYKRACIALWLMIFCV